MKTVIAIGLKPDQRRPVECDFPSGGSINGRRRERQRKSKDGSTLGSFDERKRETRKERRKTPSLVPQSLWSFQALL